MTVACLSVGVVPVHHPLPRPTSTVSIPTPTMVPMLNTTTTVPLSAFDLVPYPRLSSTEPPGSEKTSPCFLDTN